MGCRTLKSPTAPSNRTMNQFIMRDTVLIEFLSVQ